MCYISWFQFYAHLLLPKLLSLLSAKMRNLLTFWRYFKFIISQFRTVLPILAHFSSDKAVNESLKVCKNCIFAHCNQMTQNDFNFIELYDYSERLLHFLWHNIHICEMFGIRDPFLWFALLNRQTLRFGFDCVILGLVVLRRTLRVLI